MKGNEEMRPNGIRDAARVCAGVGRAVSIDENQ